jgi:hypothetical protein
MAGTACAEQSRTWSSDLSMRSPHHLTKTTPSKNRTNENVAAPTSLSRRLDLRNTPLKVAASQAANASWGTMAMLLTSPGLLLKGARDPAAKTLSEVQGRVHVGVRVWVCTCCVLVFCFRAYVCDLMLTHMSL